MVHKTLRFGKGFRVIPANSRSLSGRGAARLKGRTVQLRPDSLLFIERRERHQIRNTGRTLNFYDPPAYDRRGDPLARGKK